MPTMRNFETERTRRFRAKELSERDERTIAHIEEFGCEVVQVKRSGAGPGWSYTVGLYDTCEKPEIVTVGLIEKTAHYLLNEAARRLRAGENLVAGRHSDLIGNVDCEFRPVDPKWMRPLFGWAIWYYDSVDFPLLQAVYPDRQNRFPGEPGFDETFLQPLLQPDVPLTIVEEDFLASTNPDSSLFDWKFQDGPHARVFLSDAVNSGAEAVTYVSHDAEDGAWQFLGDSMSGDKPPVISCFHHPIDKDRSLTALYDLPLGWWAERTKLGEAWIRREHQSDRHEEADPMFP